MHAVMDADAREDAEGAGALAGPKMRVRVEDEIGNARGQQRATSWAKRGRLDDDGARGPPTTAASDRRRAQEKDSPLFLNTPESAAAA